MLIPRSVGVFMRATSKVLQSVRTCSGKVPSKFDDLNSFNPPTKSQLEDSFDVTKFISYKDYDVLVSDIDEQELIEIGSDNKVEHLSIGSFPKPPFPVQGRIHGRNLRFMVPLVCRYSGNVKANPINCWFLLNSGAPYTYLTVKSLESIVGKGFTHGLHSLSIQDEATNVECHLSKAHFYNVNILGADALEALDVSIDINWKKKEFRLIRN